MVRSRFGARRPFEGFDVANRHPAFGYSNLRLNPGEQFAAIKLWHECGCDVDVMIAALPDDPARHDHYREVIAEAEATNYWSQPVLEENPRDFYAKVRFVDRLREIVGEARSDA